MMRANKAVAGKLTMKGLMQPLVIYDLNLRTIKRRENLRLGGFMDYVIMESRDFLCLFCLTHRYFEIGIKFATIKISNNAEPFAGKPRVGVCGGMSCS